MYQSCGVNSMGRWKVLEVPNTNTNYSDVELNRHGNDVVYRHGDDLITVDAKVMLFVKLSI